MFILNPQSGIPIYRQLLDQVRRMVASGQLPAGAALPSIRDLALLHAVNPMTISKAYSLLEAEGILERHRGKPMTVASQAPSRAALSTRLQQIAPLLDQAVLAARQLQITETELAKALHRQWEESNDD
ncbi:MAG TPA: GntR family transcriptional regulator [Steroidobacteraceae bacterium]|nr:GntR family transcriptional regulator [Steroidobacteraceae bacterium]